MFVNKNTNIIAMGNNKNVKNNSIFEPSNAINNNKYHHHHRAQSVIERTHAATYRNDNKNCMTNDSNKSNRNNKCGHE